MINRVTEMTEQDKNPESYLTGFMKGLADMMVLDKQVREYSGRKRINITQSDGLMKDDPVVILRKSDYDKLIADYERLLQMEKDTDNQKITADVIGDKFIEPLKTSYDDIISGLNDKVDNKDKEINRLKAICSQYSIDMSGLSLWDMLRHKHKNITEDFNSKIWITADDRLVTDTDVKKLTEPADDNGGD